MHASERTAKSLTNHVASPSIYHWSPGFIRSTSSWAHF